MLQDSDPTRATAEGLLTTNQHRRLDRKPGSPCGARDCAWAVCQTNGYRWRILASGSHCRKARHPCGCERTFGKPCRQAVEVHGRGRGHALQARLGQTAIACPPQPEAAHPLRDRAFDALALRIQAPTLVGVPARPGGRERFVLLT